MLKPKQSGRIAGRAARIAETNPKNPTLSNWMVTRNAALAQLVCRYHAATIRNGIALEEMIMLRAPLIERNLRDLLTNPPPGDWVGLASKHQIRNSGVLDGDAKTIPDLLVVERRGGVVSVTIVEVKSGHNFDTKKVAGSLTLCARELAS